MIYPLVDREFAKVKSMVIVIGVETISTSEEMVTDVRVLAVGVIYMVPEATERLFLVI